MTATLRADPSVIESFEKERGRRLRRQRVETAAGILLFSVVLAASLHRSGFLDANVGSDPLARIGAFLGRLIPHLRADALLDGRRTSGSLASWFYDWPVWLKAVWQTVEMAILATVLGACAAAAAGVLCARNLNPFAPVRFIVRRFLEAIRTMPDQS